MNKIYFATRNGGLVNNYDISKAALIVENKTIDGNNFDEVREFAKNCKGIKKEIENPSVRYLLKRGLKVQAVKIYYDKHPELGFEKSREIVDAIEAKMSKDVETEIHED